METSSNTAADEPMTTPEEQLTSQQHQSDVEMRTTFSTAADSMREGLAGSEPNTTESARRKSSHVKNPDEQSVSITGQVEKPESEEVEPPKTFKGLQNQGATCYMNSLLQALYMTPDFRQMIYKFK